MADKLGTKEQEKGIYLKGTQKMEWRDQEESLGIAKIVGTENVQLSAGYLVRGSENIRQ